MPRLYKFCPINTIAYKFQSAIRWILFFQSLILRVVQYLIVRFRVATKSRGKSLNKIENYFHKIFINILVLKVLCEKVKNRIVFYSFIQLGEFEKFSMFAFLHKSP